MSKISKSKPRQIRTMVEKCGIIDNVNDVKELIRIQQKLKVDEFMIFENIYYDFVMYISQDLFYNTKLHYDEAYVEENGFVKLKIIKVTETEFSYIQYDNHNKCTIIQTREYADIGTPIVEGNFIILFERDLNE